MHQKGIFHRILIAGDLLPSGKNIKLFEEGNAEALFGKRVCELFQESDYSIINLEGPLTDSINSMNKTGPVLKASQACISGIKKLGVKAFAWLTIILLIIKQTVLLIHLSY